MAQRAQQWQPVERPNAPAPQGAYSPGVRAGDILFISGQVPKDPRTGALVGADVVSQARATLDNFREVVEAAGGGMQDVVAVTVYLADTNDWSAFDGVYRDYFEAPFPTRTVVGAQLRGILVEISGVARLGDA
jgi:2-iminobutanoate/2-iminopropanoate deaminase